jgi:hypothetical protein
MGQLAHLSFRRLNGWAGSGEPRRPPLPRLNSPALTVTIAFII